MNETPTHHASRRPGLSPAVQQTIFLRVMASAAIVALVVLVAAYLYLVPPGPRSIRAVVPVLHAYMLNGAEGDTLAAHRLYSAEALRRTSLDDVRVAFARRDLFESYDSLQVIDFQLLPGKGPLGQDLARVRAQVWYRSQPPAVLVAQLVLENERWRIDWITLRRGAP